MGSYVETVLGKKSVSDLGRTLTHEHLALDFHHFYVQPPSDLQEFLEGVIKLPNASFFKQYPYSSQYNLNLTDVDSHEAILEDVKLYKKFGGGTIVENTNHGIKRDLNFMQKVSRETGVNIIAGTGYYVALTQEKPVLAATQEQMYDVMLREVSEGFLDNPKVKAGFIGEVGSTYPIEEFEKKAIRATAEVQSQLKCPVTFHPGREPKAPFEIMRIYQEAGGDAKKAIMSHLDRTLLKDEDLLEFAKIGCYCQYDLFGLECSLYQLNPPVDMPSDAQRMDKIRLLVNDGKLNKVLMSHDIHTKHRLVNFGGHGYMHILKNVIPKMLVKGFTQKEIDVITIQNPAQWLTF